MTNAIAYRTGVVALGDMALFNRVAERFARAKGVTRAEAGTLLDQAICFLATCGRLEGVHLSPSEELDDMWDFLVLDTPTYFKICDQVAGRYIHHAMFDVGEAAPLDASGRPPLTHLETMEAVRGAGFVVIPEAWQTAQAGATCTNCYCGGHGDGGDGTGGS